MHCSRTRSKLPQVNSAAAPHTSQTGKPIVLLTFQHAIRTPSPTTPPNSPAPLLNANPSSLPRQISSSCCCGIDDSAAGFSAFAPAMNLPETTVVNRPSPAPLPFDLGSFYWCDNVRLRQHNRRARHGCRPDAHHRLANLMHGNRAPVAGCGAGFECIGAVRRTKVFELVEVSRYACRGDWDAVESGAMLAVVQFLAR